MLGESRLPVLLGTPLSNRLQTSSMAALLGAHTSSFGLTAFWPSVDIGVRRSDKNLPTRPLIVFVFPVPGGLASQSRDTRAGLSRLTPE
jgi:hypothetical protein